MSDWFKDKGTGVWTFSQQETKSRYNIGDEIATADNPVWDLDDGGEPVNVVHQPCGYWFKDYVATSTNSAFLYGLFDVGSLIWGVHFNGSKLGNIAYYESPAGDVNGLVEYMGDLLTVGGIGASAELRQISAGDLGLVHTYNPFNSYDCVATSGGTLVKDSVGNVYYAEGVVSSVGGRIVKLDANLGRELRAFNGTVVNGTDGHLYYPKSFAATWDAYQRPITGGSWASFYALVEDDVSDTTAVNWGTGTLYTCDAQNPQLFVHGGALYATIFNSTASQVRKYGLGNLSLSAAVSTGAYEPQSVVGLGSYVYQVGGVTSSTLVKYDLSLVQQDTLALSIGRASDITCSTSYLYALNKDYGGSGCSLHKIDPASFTITTTLDLGTTYSWFKIEMINDSYAVLGGNNSVGVVNVDSMSVVDVANVPGPGVGTYYGTKDLLVIS